MHLSNEITSWLPNPQSWSDIEGWKLPYATFGHAESLLERARTEHQLSDVVINLKRTVDSRVRHMDDAYRFKKLPVTKSVQGIYDRMIFLGLIRPKMVGHLYEIRNAIEHRDAPPPSVDRCQELLEFTWYFLKSTDHVSQTKLTSLMLYRKQLHDDFDYWMSISFPDDDDRVITFRGWIPFELLAPSAIDGWFHVSFESQEKKSEFCRRVALPSKYDHTVGFRDEDLYVGGRFDDETAARDIYRIYFLQ